MSPLPGFGLTNLIFLPNSNLQNIVSEVPVRTSSLFTADADQLDSESKEPNLLSTAIMLKRRHGMGVFVKGMTPKMLQAGVNHSITFYVYDLIVNIFSGP